MIEIKEMIVNQSIGNQLKIKRKSIEDELNIDLKIIAFCNIFNDFRLMLNYFSKYISPLLPSGFGLGLVLIDYLIIFNDVQLIFTDLQ